jgi:hypothetical protein
MESVLNRGKGGLKMSTENYNETVLLPLLEKKVHELTSALILAEAQLQIALKQKAELQKKVDSSEVAGEVG